MAVQTTLPPEIAAQNLGPGILAATVTVSIISTLFVLCRLFVRIKIIERLYLDDYFVIFSTVRHAFARLFSPRSPLPTVS